MKRTLPAILALLVLAGLSTAGIIHVPGDQPTIQAGINATSTGDTVLVADGSYSGAGNVNLDFAGRLIVVMSESGPENCTINCLNTGRGVYFHSGETNAAVFKGFTIATGYSSTGGGINVSNSSPVIESCIVRNCSGYQGGGIYIVNGNPIIVRCTITNNSATNGGAIYSTSANPTINSCIIVDNTASG
jgi:predicted outer membrane repeat protein